MESQNTGHVLKLSQPYAFGGRSYAENERRRNDLY